ncbi:L,D-transpeptidase family protein [Niveispirillum sp.]|uniref:L,D-transpeptidase family protein n=1 Tax=Niveispirillum sp. TaxID=1917217 RepID=UPI001B648A70|nr:L,D-transpeptidase family protein [Niveispirillum sp.]MBP7339041.1 L,D-transpeptidase family protein [Niveispirillum sp.]
MGSVFSRGFAVGLLSCLLAITSPVLAARDFTAALQQRLAGGVNTPQNDRDSQDLATLDKFYDQRKFAPAWIDHGKPTAKAGLLLTALQKAAQDGLNPADYGVARITTLMERGDSPDALAELEVLLSHGALDYGRDLATGRLAPMSIDSELYVEKREIDTLALLNRLAGVEDAGAELSALPPRRSEYQHLKGALQQYRELAAAGGWKPVPMADMSLKPGGNDDRLPALRARLAVTGELPVDAPVPEDPTLFDDATIEALKTFQARHGLEPDGVLGKQTLLALNITADQRAAQIAMNMERWRWMPIDMGRSYILVNLAAFHLSIFDQGNVVHEARVVVGTSSTRTPVFSRKMSYLEVNPYWHVPAKIVRDEIFPKAKKDPSYLAKQGYELLSDWSETAVPVDPHSLDWAHMTRLPYRVRQVPGDKNSLGRIKMMFPNEFDVYLHDTPSKNLFNRANRSFSHGCIRVEHPFDVAETILRLTGTVDWPRTRLDEALASGQRTIVRLKQPIPIHISYVTAFVANDGSVNFRSDIYGRDRKLATAMRASRVKWDAVEAEARLAPGGAAAGRATDSGTR